MGKRSAQILVVDDEEELAESIQTSLEAQGYQVRVSSDGESALQSIQEEPPGLILLDLGLPKLDGQQVLQHLSSNDLYSSIPVIVITGNQKIDELTATIAEGLTVSVYTKPLKIETLINLVQTVLKTTPD